MLGLALLLVPLARIVDTLVDLGLVDSIYTSRIAFLGIVIAMSQVLSHEITQTEQELYIYQQHLYELVATRTVELTDANDQLVQGINARKRIDAALQRRVDQF